MRSLEDSILAIASNRTSGASELAIEALHVLKQAAASSRSADLSGYVQQLYRITDKLAGCRPSMAAIYNCAQIFRGGLAGCARQNDVLEEMRRCILEMLDELEAGITAGRSGSIINAADFIQSGWVLTTCSYSSTLVEAIHQAVLQGKKIAVRIMQSQAGITSYGEQTKFRLAAMGVACQMLPDKLAPILLDGVDLVLLGADAVFADGSVVNGHPSLELASRAAEHIPQIPRYVICDSLKFCPERNLESIEPGFDLVPGHLWSGLISEHGVFSGQALLDYLGTPGIKFQELNHRFSKPAKPSK